jgi:putative hemolysin
METAIIIVCLLLSAFFSGMEIAYVSSNKVYLEVEKKRSGLISKILTRLTEKPTLFLASMLVGNSTVFVIYVYYMGNIVLRWVYPASGEMPLFYQLLLQVVISSFIILLTAEFIPKIFFQMYANRLIKALAIPAYVFYRLFNGISRLIIAISDLILVRLLGTKGDTRQEFFSRGELGTYITEQLNGKDEQEEEDTEIQIFRNALKFSGSKAFDIMTPRTEIAAVEMNDPVAELRQLFIETGYSKIVVYRDTPDTVVGYVHSFEMFKKPASVKSVMTPIEYAQGTMYIKDLLNMLTRKRKSMAVILDDQGGTAGIITLEDIIEELFGEIEDEHDLDEEARTEIVLPDGSYIFSASLDVEYVNQKFGLGIPETVSYTSLAGFAVHHSKGIPKTGEKLLAEGFEVIIEQASAKNIVLIKLVPLRQE